MGAAEHANRILAAWMDGDTDRLASEIDGALLSSDANVSAPTVENEEQELLESVASHLRRCGAPSQSVKPGQLAADFALLRHLSHRSTGLF